MGKKGIIGETADAFATVSEKLPKTTNAIDEIGGTLFGFFGTLLTPVKLLNMYADVKLQEVKSHWEEKVRKIPEDQFKDKIDLNVVGPTLEAFKYTFTEDELCEMFENLLVSSFDKRKVVFPSFVDIIRQLNSDEAKLLKAISQNSGGNPLIDLKYVLRGGSGYRLVVKNFSDMGDKLLENPELISAYLENLSRFGLIDIQDGVSLADDSLYTHLENHPAIKSIKDRYKAGKPGHFEIEKHSFRVTQYGASFLNACVVDK